VKKFFQNVFLSLPRSLKLLLRFPTGFTHNCLKVHVLVLLMFSIPNYCFIVTGPIISGKLFIIIIDEYRKMSCPNTTYQNMS
jgi:hypothetical protein